MYAVTFATEFATSISLCVGTVLASIVIAALATDPDDDDLF